VPEGTRYWAIQRECHNAALLQMIQAAVVQSPDETVFLAPEPKTLLDAGANLHAFSDEGRRAPRFRRLAGAVSCNVAEQRCVPR
jgi:hypothetical protein